MAIDSEKFIAARKASGMTLESASEKAKLSKQCYLQKVEEGD